MRSLWKGRLDHGVAYLRVSTSEQDLGAEAQRSAITRWAIAHRLTVVAWFEDRVSGATPVEHRPGLMEALQAVRSKKAGMLIAAKRDRFARDVVIAATVERLAHDAGALVVTADGVSVGDTPEGKLMRTLVDAFAAYERALIRCRTKAAMAVKAARGERISRHAPIGYRHEDGRLVPEPAEEALLARVREMRGRGLSIERITQVLNAEGVTIRGGRLHPTTLARVLRRREPAGRVAWAETTANASTTPNS